MRKIVVSIILIFVSILDCSGVYAVESALATKTYPILLPDLNIEENCTLSTVLISNKNKSLFTPGNKLSINFAVENGSLTPNLARQYTGETGELTVPGTYNAKLGPKQLPIQIRLCNSDISISDPKYLMISLKLQDKNGLRKSSILTKMAIVKPTPKSALSSGFANQCHLGAADGVFSRNFLMDALSLTTIRSWWTEAIIGMKVTVQGTLLRSGLVSKNDTFYIVLTSPKTKILSKVKTNELGEFKVTFKVPRANFESGGSVEFYADPRVVLVGELPLLMPAVVDWIRFDYLLSPGISSFGESNWMPIPSQECSEAFGAFTSSDNEDHDRHILARMALGLLGSFGKSESDSDRFFSHQRVYASSTVFLKSFSSSKSYSRSSFGGSGSGGTSPGSGGSSGGSTGGLGRKCYVNGYWRAGHYVNGYWRNC